MPENVDRNVSDSCFFPPLGNVSRFSRVRCGPRCDGLVGSSCVVCHSLVLLPFVTVTFYAHCTTKESVEVRTKSGLAGGKPVIFALLPFEHLTSVFCFCTLVDFQNFEYLEINQKSRYLKLEDVCPIFRLMPIN